MKDADQVLKKAEEILTFINSSAVLARKLAKPIQIGSIEAVNDQGKRNIYISAKSAVLMFATGQPTVLVNGVLQETDIYKALPNWIILAQNNNKVAHVLSILHSGNKDLISLYKIYEIIEDDVGGIEQISALNWSTTNEIRRFKHTANSPNVMGNLARHGVQKQQAPKNPMSFEESRSFIFIILKYWF